MIYFISLYVIDCTNIIQLGKANIPQLKSMITILTPTFKQKFKSQ